MTTSRARRRKTPQKNAQLLNFPHNWLSGVRADLLAESGHEQFCILLGKRQEFAGGFCINIMETLNPGAPVYHSHSLTHVAPQKEFVLYALSELQERVDVDTLVDVHTHPFASTGVSFSSVDDRDEAEFFEFLSQNFDGIGYASIVFSQTEYDARYWESRAGETVSSPLIVRSPTLLERIPWSGRARNDLAHIEGELGADGFLSRTALALGRETLKSIVGSSAIMIVGLGGLGSVIAEDLVHMGFERLVLVDDDVVEKSNLNRIVGAYWQDAQKARPKVEVVARHLRAIRPSVRIRCENKKVEEIEADAEIAGIDWIILATDNHSSRFVVQELAFRLFIPFISAGVAINVVDGAIEDYSGEVIVVRPGDRVCLTCLNRLNPTKIALERAEAAKASKEPAAEGYENAIFHAEPDIKRLQGYVTGMTVADPAVKTLNSIVGALAVEQLVEQFTRRSKHEPIIVYERNQRPVIYSDVESLKYRNKHCITCGIIS